MSTYDFSINVVISEMNGNSGYKMLMPTSIARHIVRVHIEDWYGVNEIEKCVYQCQTISPAQLWETPLCSLSIVFRCGTPRSENPKSRNERSLSGSYI